MASRSVGRFAGLLTSLLIGLPVHAQEAGDLAASLLDRADKANIAGRWAAAEVLYGEVLAQKPTNAAALEGLAFVLGAQGRLEEALAAYEAALEQEAQDPRLLYNMAALVDRAEPRRALQMWLRYIAVASNDPAERPYVARARARARRLSED